jgi:predicted acyltransferase
MVNNPGSWGFVYAPLGHAQWNGLTPTDLVFPFFMFIMGVSMYLSYKKFDFKFSKNSFIKLLRRSVLLFYWFGYRMDEFIDAPVQWIEERRMGFFTKIWQSVSSLEDLRILGVLQRLALFRFLVR